MASALKVLTAASILLETGAVVSQWLLASTGSSCDRYCESLFMECSDNDWPMREDDFKAIMSKLPLTSQCSEVKSGGLYASPVRVRRSSGGYICSWMAPERTWSKTHSALSDSRCSRIPSLVGQRLCPCREKSTKLGGLTSWGGCGSDCWVAHSLLSKFTAGVTKIKGVASTMLSDTYYAERNDSELLWFEAASTTDAVKYRLKSNAGPWKRSPPQLPVKKVKMMASTDLTNIAVVEDSDSDEQVIVWPTGNPKDLPYYQSNNKYFLGSFGDGIFLYGPGSLRYDDPLYVTDLPSNAKDFLTNTTVQSVVTTAASVVLLLRNGDVVGWGGKLGSNGGDVMRRILVGAVEVVSSRQSFAAILWDGNVRTWGDESELSDPKAPNTISITATVAAFAFLSEDGKVTVTGNDKYGGAFGPPFMLVRQDADCPENWQKVKSRSGCDRFAATKNTNVTVITDATLPQGCFSNNTSGFVFWNNDATVGKSRCLWYELSRWIIVSQEEYIPKSTIPINGITEKECTALCCELSKCAAVSFDGVKGCRLEDENSNPLNQTDSTFTPNTSTPEVVYYKTTTQFCESPPTSPYSVTRQGVTGLFATAKSFLATGSAGTTIWPRVSNTDIEQNSEYATSPIIATKDSFIIVTEKSLTGRGKIDVIYSVGGDCDNWATTRDYIHQPEPIEITSPVTQIKTTDVAATVVFENKTATVFEATPDPLKAFWMVDMVGCQWISNTEGTAYVVYDWPHTREECATRCLELPGCTGFEYIKTGRYCAPWLDHQCSNQTSKLFLYNQKPDGYELFISKDIAKTQLPKDTGNYPPEDKQYTLISEGKCTPTTNDSFISAIYLGDVSDPAVIQGSFAECSKHCYSLSDCSAFEIRDMNNSLGCKLFTSVDLLGTTRDDDDDDLFKACFTEVIDDPSIEELSGNNLNDLNDTDSLVFCDRIQFQHSEFPSSFRKIEVPCSNVTTVPGGSTDELAPQGAISRIRIPANTLPGPAFASISIVTSPGNPKYDPGYWYFSLAHQAKYGGEVFSVVLSTSSDSFFVNKFVPTQRGVATPWYHMEMPSMSSPWTSYDLIITLYPRGDPVYHFLENRACSPPSFKLTEYPEQSYALPFRNVSVEECTRFCKFTKSPLYCMSFEHTPETGECLLLFNMCTDSNMIQKPGTNLHMLSKMRPVKLSRGVEEMNTTIGTQTEVDSISSSSKGFSALTDEGSSHGIVNWGDPKYGGGVTEQSLGLGQLTFLSGNTTPAQTSPNFYEVDVFEVMGGVQSFASLSFGNNGFDECLRSPCFTTDGTNFQVSAAPAADAVQFCIDNRTTSSSFDDFTCYCKKRPSVTQSRPDACENFTPIDHWPILLFLFPAVGFYFVIYATCTWAKRETDRHIQGLSEMYFIHASPEERGTLKRMLLANKGNEIKLLQALIPNYMERAREIRYFFLWQLRQEAYFRKSGIRNITLLPYDLIRMVQGFTYGAISLRKYNDQPTTPFGYLCTTFATKISQPKKLVKEEDEGYQTNKLWSPDFFTPLVEDGARNE